MNYLDSFLQHRLYLSAYTHTPVLGTGDGSNGLTHRHALCVLRRQIEDGLSTGGNGFRSQNGMHDCGPQRETYLESAMLFSGLVDFEKDQTHYSLQKA